MHRGDWLCLLWLLVDGAAGWWTRGESIFARPCIHNWLHCNAADWRWHRKSVQSSAERVRCCTWQLCTWWVHWLLALSVSYINMCTYILFLSEMNLLTYRHDVASFMLKMPLNPNQLTSLSSVPLPSSRHHLSYGDCLKDKRENYQNCSMPWCVRQCTVIHTHEQFLKMTVGLGLGLAFCAFV